MGGVEETPRYGATAALSTPTIYPGPTYNGPQTLIHEVFHIGPYNQFTDSALANALKVPYAVVPGNRQATEENASAAWSAKLFEACKSWYIRRP